MFTTSAAGRPCPVRRTTRHHRTLTAILFLAAATVASAGSALAQTVPTISKSHEKNNDFATTRESRCTGELVAIQGKEMTHFETQDTPGMFKSKFSDHQTGTGTSATARYQFQEWSENLFESTTNTFTTTMMFRHHLIREGATIPTDDEFERLVVEFKFVGGVPVANPKDISSEECK